MFNYGKDEIKTYGTYCSSLSIHQILTQLGYIQNLTPSTVLYEELVAWWHCMRLHLDKPLKLSKREF